MKLLTLLQVFLFMAPVALSSRTPEEYAIELGAYKQDRHFIDNCPKDEFENQLKILYNRLYDPRNDLSIEKRLDHLIIALKGQSWKDLNRLDNKGIPFQQTVESRLREIAREYNSEKKACLNLNRYLKPLSDNLAMIERQPDCPWKESKILLLQAQRILGDHKTSIKTPNVPPSSAPDKQKIDWIKGTLQRFESKWDTLDEPRLQKLHVILENISPAFRNDRAECVILERFDEGAEQLAKNVQQFNQKLDRFMRELRSYRANKYGHNWEIFERSLSNVFISNRSFEAYINETNVPDKSIPLDGQVDWMTKTWQGYQSRLREMRADSLPSFFLESLFTDMDEISLAYAECIGGNRERN
ncbi:hypothetical protein FRC02_006054 [Tulasnella sp. 418]|nr:hypothetical protein FRC02_006054 [Tulasnella sp. 418]